MWLYVQYGFCLVALTLFSIHDVRKRTVRLRWVLMSVMGTMMLRLFYSPSPWWTYLLAGISITVALLVISAMNSQQIGGGDIQLFGWLGFTIGFSMTVFVLGFTAVFAVIYSLLLKKKSFPLVPFMLISFMLLLILQWKVGAL